MLNMVMYNLVQMWLTITVEYQTVSKEGLILNLRICLGVLYTNHSMIGTQDSERFHNVINALILIF